MNARLKIICCLVFLAISAAALWPRGERAAAKADDFDGQFNKHPPTASGPIAISSNDRQVWVVNSDNNSVSIINGQGIRLLRKVGTFAAANMNEIRQNGAAPLVAVAIGPIH